MPRVVVLGTGTAVGKTYVTCAIARALHARLPNASVVCVKPIETGVRSAAGSALEANALDANALDANALDANALDANALEAVCFHARPPRPHPLFAFGAAVSPHRAARLAGRPIDLSMIPTWLGKSDMTLHDTTWTMIESAGGVFSPLARGTTNLDLAVMLEPAIWLLVAPDALGVLHDLSTTLHAMRARARTPDLVVLSAARAIDESTGGNLDELTELRIVKPVAALARNDARAVDAVVDVLLAMGSSSAARPPA